MLLMEISWYRSFWKIESSQTSYMKSSNQMYGQINRFVCHLNVVHSTNYCWSVIKWVLQMDSSTSNIWCSSWCGILIDMIYYTVYSAFFSLGYILRVEFFHVLTYMCGVYVSLYAEVLFLSMDRLWFYGSSIHYVCSGANSVSHSMYQHSSISPRLFRSTHVLVSIVQSKEEA